MYSAYKLNKQGDNIQPWCTPFPIWNQSVVPCPVLTVASWPAYRFLRLDVTNSVCFNKLCIQNKLRCLNRSQSLIDLNAKPEHCSSAHNESEKAQTLKNIFSVLVSAMVWNKINENSICILRVKNLGYLISNLFGLHTINNRIEQRWDKQIEIG